MLGLDMLEVMDGAVYSLPAWTLPRSALDDVPIQCRDLLLLLLCLVLDCRVAELVLMVSQIGDGLLRRLLLFLDPGLDLDRGRRGGSWGDWLYVGVITEIGKGVIVGEFELDCSLLHYQSIDKL